MESPRYGKGSNGSKSQQKKIIKRKSPDRINRVNQDYMISQWLFFPQFFCHYFESCQIFSFLNFDFFTRYKTKCFYNFVQTSKNCNKILIHEKMN